MSKKRKKAWLWTPAQDKAFTNLKKELTTPNILTLYNPNADTIISADASYHGVGAVLQKVQGQWHPVAYASHSVTCTESQYAQIEKEALAATWACEKFATYIATGEDHYFRDRSQTSGPPTKSPALGQITT